MHHRVRPLLLALLLSAAAVNARSLGLPPAEPPAPAPWTLALLPDTQYYAAKWPRYFDDQCSWLRTHAAALNLRYVGGLGDITDNNSDKQWAAARHSLSLLGTRVPLAVVEGNHDGVGGSSRRDSRLEKYLSLHDYLDLPTIGGLYEPDRMTNSYHLLTAGGQDWLLLCLEFGPRDEVVAWAGSILERYRDRPAMILTHAYLGLNAQRLDQANPKQDANPHAYRVARVYGGVNDGEELWQKLVRRHANVVFVFCGHISGVSRLTSTNDAGLEVHQMLVDYQSETEGGQGYMRLLRFSPDGRSVAVSSYSPTLGKYKTDDGNQFSFDLTRTYARP